MKKHQRVLSLIGLTPEQRQIIAAEYPNLLRDFITDNPQYISPQPVSQAVNPSVPVSGPAPVYPAPTDPNQNQFGNQNYNNSGYYDPYNSVCIEVDITTTTITTTITTTGEDIAGEVQVEVVIEGETEVMVETETITTTIIIIPTANKTATTTTTTLTITPIIIIKTQLVDNL